MIAHSRKTYYLQREMPLAERHFKVRCIDEFHAGALRLNQMIVGRNE